MSAVIAVVRGWPEIAERVCHEFQRGSPERRLKAGLERRSKGPGAIFREVPRELGGSERRSPLESLKAGSEEGVLQGLGWN